MKTFKNFLNRKNSFISENDGKFSDLLYNIMDGLRNGDEEGLDDALGSVGELSKKIANISKEIKDLETFISNIEPNDDSDLDRAGEMVTDLADSLGVDRNHL